MDYQQEYERWCAQPLQDADLTEEFRCDQQEKGAENGLSRRQLNIINTLFSEFGNRKA